LITQDLPHCLSCRLTGKSEEEKQTQAKDFIKNAINLAKSKYEVDDYEMQIINNAAYFTRKGE